MKKYIISSGAIAVVAAVSLLLNVSIVSALASTSTLLPLSDGNYAQWTPSTGSTHYTLVDEVSCNGTTDYVSTNTVGNRESYGIDISSIPDGATITKIAIIPCASKNLNGGSNSTMNVFYRFNGTNSLDAGNYSLSGTTPTQQATTSFSSLALVKDGSSILEIGAVLSAGNKGARLSRIAAVITYETIPTAPSGLNALYVASTSTPYNLLYWSDNSSNEQGFKVERGTDGINFTQIDTSTVSNYQDFNPPSGTSYYRVRAYNAFGDSGYTNTASSTAP